DDWRWKTRRALVRFGARAIPALVEALSAREDPTIRCFAADSLGRLGPEAREASEALRHAAWHDEDASVREAAAAALDWVEGTGPASGPRAAGPRPPRRAGR